MQKVNVLLIGDELVQILVNTDKADMMLTFNLLYYALRCDSTDPYAGKAIRNSIIATREAYEGIKIRHEFIDIFIEPKSSRIKSVKTESINRLREAKGIKTEQT